MRKSLPKEFAAYTQKLMGKDLYECLEKGIQEQDVPTSIRLNPFKIKENTHVADTFNSSAFEEREDLVPWSPLYGRFLKERPNFTFDPLFHAGLYYAQEASSMMVDFVIRQLVHSPVRMLDLCAAPGGKTTALRAALPEGSLLFSNEPMRTRSQILAENVQKFGHPDVIVTNNYPHDYKKSKLLFDIILTDVPCSGEGMFRKDEGAIDEWSTKNVENCWQLQREIVSDIWHCLKPGGILIYSTCTFNAHEDEENVDWIAQELGADYLTLPIEEAWHITGNLIHQDKQHPVYRFLPGKTRGEGLFLAVLRKHGNYEEGMEENKEKKKNKKDKGNKNKNNKGDKDALFAMLNQWLLPMEQGYEYIRGIDGVYAIPNRWTSVYQDATKSLKVIHAGIKMGTDKGKGIIPDQSLSLSILLNKKAFPNIELSYEEALRFLRKEAVNLPTDTPKGYALVTYRSFPLGWEKNIGNRANNLYPQEWKIKSSYMPEQDKMVIEW